MVENCITDLKFECSVLQESINIEKKKLLQLQAELEEYQNNDDVRIGKAKARRRNRQIEANKKQVEDLATECDALWKVIDTVENDNVDMNPPSYREMTSSLNQVIIDISFAEDDLYELEKEIERAKEANVWLDKDLRKRMMLFISSAEAEREQNLLDLKKEEEEARIALEILKMEVKKAKDCLSKSKQNLQLVQAQCKDEENRNSKILGDLEAWEFIQQKTKRDEEKMMKAFMAAKGG